MNEGVEIHCTAVTTQVFTLIGLLVELGKAIAKSKGSLEAYPSIRQTSITVTSNSPIIYSSLFSSFFFSGRHVPGLGEKFCNEPGTNFSPLYFTFFRVLTGKLFHFFITLLFIIFSNCDRINFIIIFFLSGKQTFFAAIAPVISLLLEMVSCYFNLFKLLVILILIFNHPLWRILPVFVLMTHEWILSTPW